MFRSFFNVLVMINLVLSNTNDNVSKLYLVYQIVYAEMKCKMFQNNNVSPGI